MIWTLAGVLGVEPWRLTLRQMLVMHKAKAQFLWNQTASIVAMIHNVNARRSDQKPPDFFNPFGRKKEESIQVTPQQGIKILSSLLVQKNEQ